MAIQVNKKYWVWQKYIYMISSIFFATPNFLYILNAWFVRHRADDFCFSGTFREFGFFGGLKHFYLSISNRFSAFMLWSFSDLFGEKAIRIFPMVVIIFMSISVYIIAKVLMQNHSLKNRSSLAFLVSQILTFFFLYLSPTIHQSVYWRAALVHYFLPFPVLLLMLKYVLDVGVVKKLNKTQMVLFFLLSLFMAGLSESYAALQGGAFSLMLVFALVYFQQRKRSRVIYFSLAAIIATMTALAIMIISPGNSLKFTLTDQAQDLITVISISLNSASSYIYYTLRGQWVPFSVLFLLGVFLSLFSKEEHNGQVSIKKIFFFYLLTPLIIFFLIFCLSAPTAYGMTAYPEKRVLMLALMVLSSGIFFEGFLIGLTLEKYFRNRRLFQIFSAIGIVLLSVYALFSLPDLKQMIIFYKKRADGWDQQQQEIITQIDQGQKDLVVTALDAHADIAEMRDYSTFWVNVCTAQYYNVDTITAVER